MASETPGLLGRLETVPDVPVIVRRLVDRDRLPLVASVVAVVIAVILWIAGMARMDIGAMTDLGLISILPPVILLSVLLLIGVALAQLRRTAPRYDLVAVTLVVLVLVLYATPIILEPVPRGVVTWVHDGFIEYIRRTGTVAPQLEARFDWPGFFILAAFMTQAAGLADSMALADWAPVYFNLLYLVPLALMFRAMTADQRHVWAGLFIFVLTNWIGQDYFSPQALNYFLYLVILAAFLTWFRKPRPRSERIAASLERGGRLRRGLGRLYVLATPDESPAESLTPRQQAAVVITVVVVFAFIAYSHQLTPFFLVAALLGIAAFDRTVLRSLPILLGVMAVAWVSYMTVPFLQGHVVSLLKEVGRLGDMMGSNVVSRLAGSPDHELIVRVRLVFSLAVWGLAALGAFVRYRDGRRDLTLVLLAVTPLPLVALQSYGGELVLRLYLFTLPFAAFLIAGLVFGRPAGLPSILRSLFVFACIGVMAFGFLVARYGNERADAFTAAEVEGVRALYAMAPRGSLLLAATNNLPWEFQDLESYQYESFTDTVGVGVADITERIQTSTRPTFLILTRGQGIYAEAFAGLPAATWDAFVADVTASPHFRLVYRNADTSIFVPAGQAIPAAAP